MKLWIPVVISILVVSAVAFAQSSEIDKPLLAAPANMKEGATVIKWKPDFTYDTLKKGTNSLTCYNRTGQPGKQPLAVECTTIANLERVAFSVKIESTVSDKKAQQAAFEAADKDGSWVKP